MSLVMPCMRRVIRYLLMKWFKWRVRLMKRVCLCRGHPRRWIGGASINYGFATPTSVCRLAAEDQTCKDLHTPRDCTVDELKAVDAGVSAIRVDALPGQTFRGNTSEWLMIEVDTVGFLMMAHGRA